MKRIDKIIREIEKYGEIEISTDEITSAQIMELHYRGVAIIIDGDKKVAVLSKKIHQ
jgi:hypothetical protein